MQSHLNSPAEYFDSLPTHRKPAMERLRKIITSNIPEGFSEEISYGMVGYVVPHKLYPSGYHCDPKQPLPFVSVASQKNFIALYHMGMYTDKVLQDWFTSGYRQFSSDKLDMGKSCIRFKNPEQIPYELIGQLMRKISVDQWIDTYERVLKR